MRVYSDFNWSAWIRSQISHKLKELEELSEGPPIHFCSACGFKLPSRYDNYCQNCGVYIRPIVKKEDEIDIQ